MAKKGDAVFFIDPINSLKKLSLHQRIDSVRLFGMVSSQEEKEKVETLMKKIKDIKRVVNNLVIMKPSMSGV